MAQQISYAREPKSKCRRTFGLGFEIEETTGIEIGAAMGDWDWD